MKEKAEHASFFHYMERRFPGFCGIILEEYADFCIMEYESRQYLAGAK